jgi:hypothetical protein
MADAAIAYAPLVGGGSPLEDEMHFQAGMTGVGHESSIAEGIQYENGRTTQK